MGHPAAISVFRRLLGGLGASWRGSGKVAAEVGWVPSIFAKEGLIKSAKISSGAKPYWIEGRYGVAEQAAEKVRSAAFAERPGAKAPWICWIFRRAKALRSHRKAHRSSFRSLWSRALRQDRLFQHPL